MNTCKTCQHWDEVRPLWGRNIELAECLSGKFMEGDHDYDTDCVIYTYEEGGSFLTGPDFGCIHYEEKK